MSHTPRGRSTHRHCLCLRHSLIPLVLPLLLTGLLMVLSPTEAYAQVGEYRSDFAVGASGGMTFNRVFFDPTIKQVFKPGTTFGLTLRYTCERYFGICCAIQAEVNFAQMGWQEVIETSEDTYQRTISYCQIPLLASLGFGKEHKGVMGYVVLGPQIGFSIGDKDKRGGEWSEETLALRPNQVTEQYNLGVENKFEYGLTGGLGLAVNTGIGHFMIEGRYFYALSDMFHNGKTDYFARSANGAIVAKITYMFDVIRTKER